METRMDTKKEKKNKMKKNRNHFEDNDELNFQESVQNNTPPASVDQSYQETNADSKKLRKKEKKDIDKEDQENFQTDKEVKQLDDCVDVSQKTFEENSQYFPENDTLAIINNSGKKRKRKKKHEENVTDDFIDGLQTTDIKMPRSSQDDILIHSKNKKKRKRVHEHNDTLAESVENEFLPLPQTETEISISGKTKKKKKKRKHDKSCNPKNVDSDASEVNFTDNNDIECSVTEISIKKKRKQLHEDSETDNSNITQKRTETSQRKIQNDNFTNTNMRSTDSPASVSLHAMKVGKKKKKRKDRDGSCEDNTEDKSSTSLQSCTGSVTKKKKNYNFSDNNETGYETISDEFEKTDSASNFKKKNFKDKKNKKKHKDTSKDLSEVVLTPSPKKHRNKEKKNSKQSENESSGQVLFTDEPNDPIACEEIAESNFTVTSNISEERKKKHKHKKHKIKDDIVLPEKIIRNNEETAENRSGFPEIEDLSLENDLDTKKKKKKKVKEIVIEKKSDTDPVKIQKKKNRKMRRREGESDADLDCEVISQEQEKNSTGMSLSFSNTDNFNRHQTILSHIDHDIGSTTSEITGKKLARPSELNGDTNIAPTSRHSSLTAKKAISECSGYIYSTPELVKNRKKKRREKESDSDIDCEVISKEQGKNSMSLSFSDTENLDRKQTIFSHRAHIDSTTSKITGNKLASPCELNGDTNIALTSRHSSLKIKAKKVISECSGYIYSTPESVEGTASSHRQCNDTLTLTPSLNILDECEDIMTSSGEVHSDSLLNGKKSKDMSFRSSDYVYLTSGSENNFEANKSKEDSMAPSSEEFHLSLPYSAEATIQSQLELHTDQSSDLLEAPVCVEDNIGNDPQLVSDTGAVEEACQINMLESAFNENETSGSVPLFDDSEEEEDTNSTANLSGQTDLKSTGNLGPNDWRGGPLTVSADISNQIYSICRDRTNSGKKDRTSLVALEMNGIFVRHGRWAAAEDKVLKDNCKRFMDVHNLSDCQPLLHVGQADHPDEIRKFIKDTEFHRNLCWKLNRTVASCIDRARRLFGNHVKGFFSDFEIDQLKQYYMRYGNEYAKIAHLMGRTSQAIHDKIKSFTENDVLTQSKKKKDWTKEEDKQLIKGIEHVLNVRNAAKISLNQDIPWVKVAEFVPTRTNFQCRRHWQQKLSFKERYQSEPHKWNKVDYAHLIECIYFMKINEEREIDWQYLSEKFKDKPLLALKMVWHSLKTTIPNFKILTFDEIRKKMYENYMIYLK